jgi:protease-4
MRLSSCLLSCLVAAAVVPLTGWNPAEAQQEQASKPIVAVFSLDRPVTEAPQGEDFLFGSLGSEPLKDLITRLKKVRDDEAVKAVVLLPGSTYLGYGQIEEIRQVLDQLKSAGKEIYVHAESFSMRDYVLSAGASKISVVPTGIVLVTGIRSETPYVRGLLDLIHVQPDFMTCGAYKSAAEMFMRKGPSEEAERMNNWLLDSMYETAVRLIAKGRGVTAEKARQWIDGGLYTAEKAKQAGIIDAIDYRQNFVAELKSKYGSNVQFDRRYGKEKREKIDLSSPLGVLKLWAELLQGPAKKKPTKPAVAIVYVEGPILPGNPEPSLFGSSGIAYSSPIRKALEKAAGDDSVKAVVLRVDSPGGSATASEIILNATKRVKAKKPLVVSMGDVAGSGGYYVACGADTIFADASTITASIGVVGGKFATTGMWNKIGVTWKSYGRGANSGILSARGLFSDEERRKMQELMSDVYDAFKAHVVAIRGNRLKKGIDELAGGRVFTGQQALKLGLVDKLGGLEDAIQYVAQQAKIKDYEVRVLPKPKSFMEMLLSDLETAEDKDDPGTISMSLKPVGLRWSPAVFEAAIPYLEGLDPYRVRAVRSALQQLSLFEQERVILTTPVIAVLD